MTDDTFAPIVGLISGIISGGVLGYFVYLRQKALILSQQGLDEEAALKKRITHYQSLYSWPHQTGKIGYEIKKKS